MLTAKVLSNLMKQWIKLWAEVQMKRVPTRQCQYAFHAFYGFVGIIAIAIIYSYRAQLKGRVYLLYGFGGLFIMGLGIRAMLVGQAA